MSDNLTPNETPEANSEVNKEQKKVEELAKYSAKWWMKETKELVVLAFIIFALRSTFFEPFRIPSGSMIPTLMIGDFILVNKFSYGFKFPYSDLFEKGPWYLTKQEDPKRGDVIVFRYPKDRSLDFIKRVVGLPGDKIEVVDKKVFVNGKLIEETEFDGKDIMSDMDDKFKEYRFKFTKTKTGEHLHTLQKDQDSNRLSNGEWVVPADQYFCMGDNRDFSADSRVWGFVPKQNVKGKALFVWFSFILPGSDDAVKLRLHRIGTKID